MTTGAVACSPVQDAVFKVLNVAGFTTAIGGRLYTDVPQSTAFPFAWLSFADPMSTPLSSFGTFAAQVHLELHVYSAYEGDKEALDVLSSGVARLHHLPLPVTGYTVPLVNADQSHAITVEDFNGQAIRHGIARIDVYAFAV